MLTKKTAQLRTLAVSMLLSAGIATADSGLEAAGLAVYTDTARDIYIAGLLTPNATLPENMSEVSGPISMEYRVATRRISSRGFSGTILLQSELGSGQRAPEQVVDALGELKQKIQGSLLSGDQFRTSLSADGVTSFSLNGEELLDIDDPGVFVYLLEGWVGGSSSALMRDSLLAGKMDPAVLARYESLAPSSERVQMVASWSAEVDNSGADGQDESEMRLVSAPLDKEVKAAAGVVAVQQVASASKPAVATPGKKSASSEPAVAKSTGKQPESVAKAQATSEKQAAAEQQVVKTGADAAQAAAVIAVVEKEEVRVDQAELLKEVTTSAVAVMDDREYKRLLSAYVAKVMSKVLRKVNYPRRAVARENEGSVEVLAQLNEMGELLDVSMEASSGYKLLDRAALKAVEDAAPFPQLSAIAREEFLSADGQNYVLMIPVKFQLQK